MTTECGCPLDHNGHHIYVCPEALVCPTCLRFCGDTGPTCAERFAAPVSEPAAHPDALPDGTFSKSTMKRHAALKGDAASGEGLPDIKLRRYTDGGWGVRIGNGAIPEVFDTPEAALNAALDNQGLLTTTGQGDVERLVEAATTALAWLDSYKVAHDGERLREALAPFGQQQEGQG